MSELHDLVIRGGSIADGSGGALFDGDVAITNGRIVAVGTNVGEGREEIDATGLLVTPGFVDIHTHYDGQVTWESRMTPSSDHGVTTIVTGNCGVGFAPCREADHEELIQLMAGVEDIPEVVMAEGLSWAWESFPDYLNVVDNLPHDVDIAAMVPHSALRVYVMGKRAVARDEATPEDIEKMAALVREALDHGAIGFGTSRAVQQRSATGESIPSVRAAESELRGILMTMAEAGTGVFQALSDFYEFTDIDGEFAMFKRLITESGRPMSFTVNQKHSLPDGWRRLLELTAEAAAEGLPIKAQVLGRPTGLLLGHDISTNPFAKCRTYMSLSDLPFDERIARLREPEIRAQILSETSPAQAPMWKFRFELSDPPMYEPDASESIAARAAAAGVAPEALAYDLLLQRDGHQILFHAFQNYAAASLDACFEMLTHPNAVLGLGDGGAHLGLVCDASYPSTMLGYWSRDRVRGPKIGVADVVRALTSATAETVGLFDRGRIAVGYKADVNVIDYARVREKVPTVLRDLPAGGRRIVQGAEGYVATIVSGQIISRDGVSTGALPGRLVRGQQPAPVAAGTTS